MTVAKTGDGDGSAQKHKHTSGGTLLDWLAVILPPTTVLTALAFWFGYTLTASLTNYLGIDVSTLEFTTTDYLLRSTDALIVPATLALIVILAGLGTHALVLALERTGRWTIWLRAGSAALVLLGMVLVALGIQAMFVTLTWLTYYLAPPLLMGGGVTAACYGFFLLRSRDRRPGLNEDQGGAPAGGSASTNAVDTSETTVPAWERSFYVAAFLLMILVLFWGTSLYAGALGLGRAEALEASLAARPSVTVYSSSSLSLLAPVTEERIDSPDAEYSFRYSGLRLLIHSADKYFLLPDGWSHGAGRAIILENASTLRFEFSPGEP